MQGRGREHNVGWSEDVEGVGGLETQGLCRTGGSQRGDRGWEGEGQPVDSARRWKDCRHPDSHASAFNFV